MYIREAEVKSFGGIREKSFTFTPGLNVIYGENEAGKSTLQNFLVGMLFGMEKPRGRGSQDAPYTRYEPWQTPSYYAGGLRFSTGGQDFYLERNFYHKEKSAYLVNERDGEELSVEHGDLEMLLGGMSKSAYENTFLLRQGEQRPGSDLMVNLKDEMSNLAETGDGSFQLSQVLERLNQQKKDLGKRCRKLEDDREQERIRLQTEVKLLEEQLEKLQGKYKEDPETQIYTDLLENHFADEKKKVETKGFEVIGAEESWNKKMETKKSGTEEFEIEESVTEESDEQRKIQPLLVFGVAASMMWLFLREQIPGGVWWILQLIFLGAIVAGLWQSSRAKRRQQEMRQKQQLHEEQLQRQKKQMEQQIEQQMERQMHQKQQQLERKMEADRKHAVRQTLEEQLRETEIQLENRRQAWTECAGASSEISSAIRNLQQQIRALTLAAETLQGIASGQSADVTGQLEQEMTELFARITEHHYERAGIGKKGGPALEAGHKMRRPEDFSGGTASQLYFSYRMAAGNLLEGDETLPFLLDEPFAQYDDRRLEQVLRWIGTQHRQIFLFTCQKREIAMLKELEIPFSTVFLDKETVKI